MRARRGEQRLAAAFPRVANDLPPREIDPSQQPLREVELWDLVSAMGRIMRECQSSKPANIVYDETPIHVYMQQIHDRLIREQQLSFSSMFQPGMHKSRMIGVFLATLELARNYGVVVEQQGLYSEMWLKRGEDFQAVLEVSEEYSADLDLQAGPGKPR